MRTFIVQTAVIVAFAVLGAAPAAAGRKIAILVSADEAAFREVVAGFSAALGAQGVQSSYELLDLGGDASPAGTAVGKTQQGGFLLLLSGAWQRRASSRSTRASLDCDYKEVGQCAAMALRVLNGEAASSIPPISPRSVQYSLNMKMAQQLQVALPDQIMRGAKQTF